MKTVLITGASSGIGRETAILFAGRGWNVAATMRNPEKLSMFADTKGIRTYLLNVRDKESVASCIAQVVNDFSKIDVIVNNAGVYFSNPLESTADDSIEDIIDTNIKGVLYITKLVVEHFRKNKSGTIVNVSSIAGRVTFPFQSVYHASKWAVEGFSESLYYELKPLHINVRVVEPGMVRTGLYHSLGKHPSGQCPGEYQSRFNNWFRYLMKSYDSGNAPELYAATIFKAASSGGSKLRYTSDSTTKAVFFLRSLLPLSLFRGFIIRQSKL